MKKMKLLLYDMSTYTQTDIMITLDAMGVEYRNILYKFKDIYVDEYFERKVKMFIEKEKYDAIFSVNFFPILARICNEYEIPYISWSYDSPLNITKIDASVLYQTNYIFLFDRVDVDKLKKEGVSHVFHLPLAVNTKRLDGIIPSSGDMQRYRSDISMVGQLYDLSFKGLIAPLNPYEQGFLSAIIEAQFGMYGGYILDNVITDELVRNMNKAYEELGQKKYTISKEGLKLGAAKYITHIERKILLGELSEKYDVSLFGPSTDTDIPKVNWKGTAGYFDEMPIIFKKSKINLNISLKCIQSGIPLRALDIVGCKGFLLSNWQQELAEYFTDGEEVVMYTSIEDAIAKCDYYMKNDCERMHIAENAYRKVKEVFRYEDRFEYMFSVCGLVC